jgi:hypothetical protein
MNLFLAIVWLVLGLGVLAWQLITGDQSWGLRLGDTRISAAWLPMLLALYNLARWWGIRSARANEQYLRTLEASRPHHARHHAHREPPGPPDPNFDFTNDPPQDDRAPE